MAYTDREDLNYLGQLYLIGANQTPFLSMMGGLTQGAKTTTSFNFPIAQPWNLMDAGTSAAAAIKSEATSITDVTENTYTRGQDYNTCQIMKYPYGVSFAKQSTYGEVGAITVVGGNPNQPVKDELAFQRAAALRQMAIDIEYCFLNQNIVAQSASNTVAKTKGMKYAISTNTVAGGNAALSKSMIQELLREMATNGSIFQNVVVFANAYQKQAITDLYGYAPESRNVGGLNIKQIETDFGMLGVVFDPFMPTDEIYLVEMSVCTPVFCPSEGQLIRDVEVATTTAKKGGFLYTQIGLDFGPEEYHGSITGLADGN
jgi:hypothetical protein